MRRSDARSTEDRERFRKLHEDCYRRVLAYTARRIEPLSDAQDVVAEVFLIAWRRLDVVPDNDEALPWLLATARRVLANQRRGWLRRRRLRDRLRQEPSAPAADPSADHDRAERIAAVTAALATLSADDQELLRLATWDELPHTQIARMFGTTTSNIDVRLHRARKCLVQRYMQDFAAGGHLDDVDTQSRKRS